MPSPPTAFRRSIPPPRNPRPGRILLGVAAAVFLGVFVFPWLASFATDWLWFNEIHFESVFLTSLVARALLFVVTGVVAFVFIYANIRWARRGVADFPALFMDRGGGVRVDVSRFIPRLLLVGAALVSLVAALVVSAQWMPALMFLHGVPVGQADPLFGRDIGFYLFQLPAISGALAALVALTLVALVAATALYATRGAIALLPRRVTIEPRPARHLGVLIALLFVLFSVQLWFVDSSALLYSTTGPLVGASYADVHVLLGGIRLSAVVALLAAALVIYGVLRRQLVWFAFLALVGYVAVGVVFRGVAPALEQKFVIAPNELARERPYLQQHIAATRRAWRLDSVATRDLEGDVQLSMADIRANAPTIDNVRLWERDLLKQTFGQLQEIRTYYDFATVNDDRYVIDGHYRQVHLSARELNPASLPTRNFINERLTFTHGMGVAMAPVNEVTAEGLPVLFIKDLPPVSTISIKVTRPQIYYGQLTNSYVFVGTGQKEFDYPEGDRNVYTNYTGRGGVPIGSFLRRALYAWQLGSTDILLSSYLSSNARILYRRNIVERAQAALPFLDFDSEPYLVVTDSGTLKWILDAYTSSSNWPYSEPSSDGVNYQRNSVKVVIDAYDGTVDAYLVDPGDPIVRTYAAIFGAIFKPQSAMPGDIRAHLRYPGDLFRQQTTLYATYHMVDPDAFYHREDQWQYPGVEKGTPNENPFMRHIILRLPGETTPEFIYMTPFTPRGKDNLAAWMAARMDGANYGKLVAYRFPKQSLVYGPKQIANRINQETDISQQLTLWDQKGSSVIRGELLVIPIEESLIYVQPLYLRAEGGTIPELKRVVVAHENRVAMAETLEAGLAALFGGAAPARTTIAATDTAAAVRSPNVGVSPPAGLLQEAQQHYDGAITAQRAGDWAAYGREIEQLGKVLKQLRAGRP
ncbi:MAG TPA: UPF0182 family protein [Gemmatimonadaceae bacterium]|jgi:hypothetical protein